ncbi:hypothetical protein BDV27DRAFT_122038 [Aspergillus caelatus]|uniref:Uncharacterized protein n=2 Tax=Aspergillus subgen. Circumdati TaxID=2720871 RepID=A0A5N7AFX6_9EURO|nr:uncharacterized protein BDV27DRAFT_122038 [Aspergillus caelatus]KAE8368615.1 hypothetical protein BDV27DRAFT_122038 [Aspergillus caelatus]KAE8418462.1 hypothetical protein BDV36DRAFT_253997 [Aspergillus pseudocaelatus]
MFIEEDAIGVIVSYPWSARQVNAITVQSGHIGTGSSAYPPNLTPPSKEKHGLRARAASHLCHKVLMALETLAKAEFNSPICVAIHSILVAAMRTGDRGPGNCHWTSATPD